MKEEKNAKTQNYQSPEKRLGAGYITDFFIEIKALTEQYAIYKNLIIELNSKTGSEETPQFEEIEKNAIKTCVQNVRFYAHKIFIHYCTLKDCVKIPKEVDDKVVSSYSGINSTNKFLPSIEEIENFVIEINKLLVKDVIKSLLENSEDILNSLYQK